MLDYSILNRKATIKIPSTFENGNEVECYDLLSNSYKEYSRANFRPVVVNKRYVARPDLVSFVLYGSDDYTDIICKVNGISNPFELNEGDIILVPDTDDLTKFTQNASPNELAVSTDDFASINKTAQKQRNERRSSNEQVVGETNYIIDKSSNLIFY